MPVLARTCLNLLVRFLFVATSVRRRLGGRVLKSLPPTTTFRVLTRLKLSVAQSLKILLNPSVLIRQGQARA